MTFRKPARCPLCESLPAKVIYMGAPMLLCPRVECGCLFGAWSFVHTLFPFAVTRDEQWAFCVYEGSYLKALWRWMNA